MQELTERQREVLEFIKEQVREKGYPPSVREIGDAVGLRSSSTVHGHLRRLESKGYIRRDPTKPRAIEVIQDDEPVESLLTKDLVSVPLVGSVTAGQPILAVENIEDYVPLPRDFASDEATFMLRIKGDSMIDAGILDGDYVVVRQQPDAINGDIVVALLEDEATVKRFYREANYVRLQPENPLYDPILTTDVQILGKVIGVLRRLQ
ncbi:MAG: transcriptional repressor LexA [Firmicutes bacterium]|jgi:repressor LexA|nr:transcriptional repressor LexA [Bacillota bacterium]